MDIHKYWVALSLLELLIKGKNEKKGQFLLKKSEYTQWQDPNKSSPQYP